MTPTESALVVVVPAAEPLVAAARAHLDPAAAWAVPAHVTVLYPFLPPDRIDDAVLTTLADAVSSVPGFAVAFGRVEWFAEDVAWLAPEPDQPFRDLTAAVWQRFPEVPPYAGEYPDIVPHLTIGQAPPVGPLRRHAQQIARKLPIHAEVTAVQLLCGAPEPGAWRVVAEFALGSQ